MTRVGRGLVWAGPWLGLAFFVWRQQTLERSLSDWVAATNAAMQGALAKFAAESGEAIESAYGHTAAPESMRRPGA